MSAYLGREKKSTDRRLLWVNGRPAASLKDGTLWKSSRHGKWSRAGLSGWAFHVALIREAEVAHAHSVGVKSLDGRPLVLAPMDLFLRRGVVVGEDTKFGKQLCLEESLWTAAASFTPPPIPARQLDLGLSGMRA